ncbi:proton-translocating NADH-quinone oxidoreductase, chain L [Bacillus toyonensis]|uniref:NADH-quinone oxidoreductase subunit L n=1 Tax=Bacillus toyonensis TaxID=155322 RepID=UPI000278E1FA|nr:NADH-quinone oxidoreductase subunit L [Bacillus toyonensis]EJQ35415.1 proton-translocating NADH-quinone oxidoreductase, chain L [Bacillus toyonensis]PEB17471.1 NADH-quinone oxidoreductase subunit L [Bacillus toyonensis]PEG00357.1 NADH-quinone oxidoreductase subunit L [Bacillus toyonensis]PEJ88113.1 NADH-quinone oxidoreductase subunit L [Bacillus toyonensis]PEL34859.1 NADH-quinone oxidoreductase subunit L [Bacillus toyonensis]
MIDYAWLIPLFPLVSFFLLIMFGKKIREGSSVLSIFFVSLSFILAVLVLIERFSKVTVKHKWVWLRTGDIDISFGFEVTALGALMLFIVTLVSLLVHVYSKGYMKGDARLPTFYAYLGLFTFAMLGLVISTNLLQLYIFWELVGLGSFLLIGFYFFKEEAKAAAKKAFIMTRIGDVGLFIGMILIFWHAGSFEYDAIFRAIHTGDLSPTMITITAILIFIGAMGKSGQFPLHTWLPDAMEGPTPVSALIHAATMVAAGVYLVATMFPLFSASAVAMQTVAIVGAFTAIFAASIGLVQTDIKRVLAYSTVSQLGYMMLALGSAGYVAGIFHLTTHAFFKALLFLAAGSVIHAVHTQNINKMGGLQKKMKVTGTLFLIGTLAISGVPLLSGFFSKDEILAATWMSGNYFLFVLAVFAAFLTAFYMFRLYFLVFTGEAKTKEDVHDSPRIMTYPMIVLGVLAVVAGYINTPWFGAFLGDWLTKDIQFKVEEAHGPVWIMIVATLVSFGGIALAYFIYGKKTISKNWAGGERSFLHKLLKEKYYVDELYNMTVIPITKGIAHVLRLFEVYVVEGIAVLIASLVKGVSGTLSRLQNGNVQVYGTVTAVSLAVLVIILLYTGGDLR